MGKIIDIVGNRYNKLLVLKAVKENGKRFSWQCLCDCGKVTVVRTSNLKSGKTTSCGCFKKQTVKTCSVTHNGRYKPEYNVWCKMKARCLNTNVERYPHYGGRGITVCDRWLESFENFLEDMGERPSSKHSIERKDVNGNYCKENCVWINDSSMQIFNRTQNSNNTSNRTGVFWRKDRNHWFVMIKRNGENHYCGSYKVYENAVEAAKQAEIDLYGCSRSYYI